MRRPHSFARLVGVAVVLLGLMACASAFAEPPKMKMTTPIPPGIATPNSVETRL